MAKFTIGIFGREHPSYPHSACFEDQAKALRDALRALGHELAPFGPDRGRLILFGTQSGFPVESAISYNSVPDDAIIFNAEQMTAFDNDVKKQMLNFERWARHVIWDYSSLNAQMLRDAGAKHVVHCPLGYIESMKTIEPVEEDIEVLFYGSMNVRRAQIIDKLVVSGLQVEHLFGVYGKERDAVIARAKVVLNLHHYDNAVFEIFRVSHLVANKKCVVSEGGGKDLELEKMARRITDLVSLDDLADACKELVENDDLRRGLAEKAHETFATSYRLEDSVRNALEQS